MTLLIGTVLAVGLMLAVGVWGADSRDGVDAPERNGLRERRSNVWW